MLSLRSAVAPLARRAAAGYSTMAAHQSAVNGFVGAVGYVVPAVAPSSRGAERPPVAIDAERRWLG
jgi:hypothetical protein